jgi:hypothetical protein
LTIPQRDNARRKGVGHTDGSSRARTRSQPSPDTYRVPEAAPLQPAGQGALFVTWEVGKGSVDPAEQISDSIAAPD